MPQDIMTAVGKAGLGGGGAAVAVMGPSEYVSYFDRVYDLGAFCVSGDDAARLVGMAVGVLVGLNVIYTIIKDIQRRWRKRRKRDKDTDE